MLKNTLLLIFAALGLVAGYLFFGASYETLIVALLVISSVLALHGFIKSKLL